MMFFRQKFQDNSAVYCVRCQVSFKPRPDDSAEFAGLCVSCSREPREIAQRMNLVVEYAKGNWRDLEETARQWQAERFKAYAENREAYLNQLSRNQLNRNAMYAQAAEP
jgi:hypothetical protein